MIKKIDSMKLIINRGSLDNKDKIGLKDLMNNKDKLVRILDKNMKRINNLHQIDKIDQNGNNFKEIKMEIIDKIDMIDKIKNNNMMIENINNKMMI